MKKKTSVVLLNMGGPAGLDDVQPFLYNLFMDPDIISIPFGRLLRPFIAGKISSKRAGKVRGYYEKIGGKSPILDITLEQAADLEKRLSEHGDFKTHVAMRYWHPFTDEAVKKITDEQPDRIILLPLYPQFSKATSGSSINEFKRVWKAKGNPSIELVTIRDWHNNSLYIKGWAEAIKKSAKEAGEDPFLLFSAHGIPVKMVEDGDPYQEQTEKTVRLILDELGWQGKWLLSYQSRVGPVKWLEPSTEDVIKELGEKKTGTLMMVPISFVSDHSETLYEMDIQYRELAAESGIGKFIRVPSLNSGRPFIEALKDVVISAVEN